MPNVNDAFPSKYFRAADFEDAPQLFVMAAADFEMMGDERKLVLHFQNQDKGLVLNKTNANNIAKLYGQNTEGWAGKEIVLFSMEVDVRGETVPAIRVRAPKKKAPVKSEDMNDAVPF